MRGRRDGDAARPCLYPHVVEDRDVAGSLHNSTEAADKIAKIRQGTVQTALAEAAVLGAIGSVDNRTQAAQVHRRRLLSSRRHGSGLSAPPAGALGFAWRSPLQGGGLERRAGVPG